MFILLMSLFTSTVHTAKPVHNIPYYVVEAARVYSVSPTILYAICLHESLGNPRALVATDGGSASYGLCQVKLKTARWLGFNVTPLDLYDPELNAHVAASYLSKQLARYSNYNKAISAYNAGHYTHINKKYLHKVLSISKELS